MKMVSVVFVVLASLCLLGCPEENKGGAKPASTTKAGASAAPSGSGGW